MFCIHLCIYVYVCMQEHGSHILGSRWVVAMNCGCKGCKASEEAVAIQAMAIPPSAKAELATLLGHAEFDDRSLSPLTLVNISGNAWITPGHMVKWCFWA